MILSVHTERFNYHDKQLVRKVILGRWLTTITRLWKTLLLPFGAIGMIGWLIHLAVISAEGPHSVWYNVQHPAESDGMIIFYGLLVAGAFIMLFINIIIIVSTLPAVYIDRIIAEKKVYHFKPEPYYIPGDDDFYIKTGIPHHPFLQVNFEAYSRADETPMLALEMTPKTHIILNIYTLNSPNDDAPLL